MLAQFLSRTTNKRTDKYGGSSKNRARIIVDIYNAIRKEIPIETGFAVGIKLNSVEFQDEGLTNNEAIEIAQEIDDCGFDFIELSGGTYEDFKFEHRRESTVIREAFFLEFAEKIKPAIKNAIVYVTGGFRTAPAMIQAIKENATDGIGLGRPITQDFELPNQILNGLTQSAAEWPFKDDYNSALFACTCQMIQAGLTEYSPEKGVNYGIMDLTDEKILKEYQQAQNEIVFFINSYHLDETVVINNRLIIRDCKDEDIKKHLDSIASKTMFCMPRNININNSSISADNILSLLSSYTTGFTFTSSKCTTNLNFTEIIKKAPNIESFKCDTNIEIGATWVDNLLNYNKCKTFRTFCVKFGAIEEFDINKLRTFIKTKCSSDVRISIRYAHELIDIEGLQTVADKVNKIAQRIRRCMDYNKKYMNDVEAPYIWIEFEEFNGHHLIPLKNCIKKREMPVRKATKRCYTQF